MKGRRKYVVMVSPQHSTAKTMKEFVALAKKNPDKFNVSTPPIGTTPQLQAEVLKLREGLQGMQAQVKAASLVRRRVGNAFQERDRTHLIHAHSNFGRPEQSTPSLLHRSSCRRAVVVILPYFVNHNDTTTRRKRRTH